ncbi:MAG TPA: response regulator transcription factor [Streptosporangiaceae bacterium]|jgi:DNA-binding NarL/FixJ family response regulator
MIRILIADDQPLVRSGLRSILGKQADLEVVGEAADGQAAVTAGRQLRPDVVLMDIRMPVLDGLAATRQLTLLDPPPKVVVLTTFELDEYIYAALKAGASGFLLKDTEPQQLIDAIRTVDIGDAMLSPTVTRRLIESFVNSPAPGAAQATAIATLTNREADILQAMARGLSNAEIAGRLHLGEATVKTHVTRILAKLAVRDRLQAVVLAYETGIVRPRPTA